MASDHGDSPVDFSEYRQFSGYRQFLTQSLAGIGCLAAAATVPAAGAVSKTGAALSQHPQRSACLLGHPAPPSAAAEFDAAQIRTC